MRVSSSSLIKRSRVLLHEAVDGGRVDEEAPSLRFFLCLLNEENSSPRPNGIDDDKVDKVDYNSRDNPGIIALLVIEAFRNWNEKDIEDEDSEKKNKRNSFGDSVTDREALQNVEEYSCQNTESNWYDYVAVGREEEPSKRVQIEVVRKEENVSRKPGLVVSLDIDDFE